MGHSGPGGFYSSVHKIKEHLDFLCCGAEQGQSSGSYRSLSALPALWKPHSRGDCLVRSLSCTKETLSESLWPRSDAQNELRNISLGYAAVNMCRCTAWVYKWPKKKKKKLFRGASPLDKRCAISSRVCLFLLVYDHSQRDTVSPLLFSIETKYNMILHCYCDIILNTSYRNVA